MQISKLRRSDAIGAAEPRNLAHRRGPTAMRARWRLALNRSCQLPFSAARAGAATFEIDLENFVRPNEDQITNVTYPSGNLTLGDFSNVHSNGMDDIFFTGTDRDDQNAIGGRTAVFDVETPVPEPSSTLLLGTVLGGLVVGVKKLRRA